MSLVTIYMKGRVRILRKLNRLLEVFEGKDEMRYFEIRDAVRSRMPKLNLKERTLMRYLNKHVKMGNLEKISEPGKARYRLSNQGGMMRLVSMISASMRVQSDRYPDLQKGSIILEIKKGKELFGLLIALQDDMRVRFGERWKDSDWGRSVSRAVLHLINEFLQPKPAFVEKIPRTDLFFFKPPPPLYEIMTSAVQSRDYETEEDIIMGAMNEWGSVRERKRQAPISLEQFPCVQSAVEKGIFKTPKEAVTEALKNLEAQMRTQSILT